MNSFPTWHRWFQARQMTDDRWLFALLRQMTDDRWLFADDIWYIKFVILFFKIYVFHICMYMYGSVKRAVFDKNKQFMNSFPTLVCLTWASHLLLGYDNHIKRLSNWSVWILYFWLTNTERYLEKFLMDLLYLESSYNIQKT